MSLRRLVTLLVVLAVLAPPVSAVTKRARVFRVGVLLQGTSPPRSSRPADPFVTALRGLGYIEGENLVFDWRGAAGESARFSELAAELVAWKPDVIVADTTPGSLAAKRATKTIPIVMVNVSDPVNSGLVASLARPGGNVTGGTDFGVEVSAKRLELLHDAVPAATRVAVLLSDNPVHPAQLAVIESAARSINLAVLPTVVRSAEEFDQAFESMAAKRVEALMVLGGAPFSSQVQADKLAKLAAGAKLPTIFEDQPVAAFGGLLSYAPSAQYRWTVAASYVDKILKGAKPADLPVEQPTTFELVINLRAARALGLTIAPSLLLRADEVIQ